MPTSAALLKRLDRLERMISFRQPRLFFIQVDGRNTTDNAALQAIHDELKITDDDQVVHLCDCIAPTDADPEPHLGLAGQV